MKIKILTLFPELFSDFFKTSLIGKAIKSKKIQVELFNLRDWTKDKHNTVDDTPYGGKAGMVLKADVIDQALTELKTKNSQVILLTPQGKTLDQKKAKALAKNKDLILICGRYEGFDERVLKLVDQEISIGDYVLNGGEIPAMVIIEAVARLIPGVVGKQESIENESFTNGIELDYPQYTNPQEFVPKSIKSKKLSVPKVLLSGNHQKIADWRKKMTRKKS